MEFSQGSVSLLLHLLDDVAEVSLKEAVKELEGISYFHGIRQKTMVFDYRHVEVEIQECEDWAMGFGELAAVGVQRLAAIRAWTGDICYVITSTLRDKDRSLEKLIPITYFMKLFFGGLHRLPARFLFEGDLYRGEHGVRTNWDTAIRVGRLVQFFAPLSFSTDMSVHRKF